jgi:predicted enzyme involved in methoxymalonyl-ACP biosynthesis
MALRDWHEADGQARTYARLNTGLAERLRDVPDARLVDVSHLVALSGASWWTLHRSWFLANVAIPDEAASLLARDYAATGAALRGLARKCLVLDLDDTLWGGVVGEVGTDRIQLSTYPGNILSAIQQIARQLQQRGFILVLNSHNNENDA